MRSQGKVKNHSSLFWFRRDLRLSDNRALFEACKNSEAVYTVFVFDTNILSKNKNKNDQRVKFIFESIKEIQRIIKSKGGQLIILSGNPETLIPDISKKLGVQKVYTNEDYEGYAKKRDSDIRKVLVKKGIEFEAFKDHVIFNGREIMKKDGTPYRVYTPYKNEWLKRLNSNVITNYTANLNNLSTKKDLKVNQVENLKSIGFNSIDLKVIPGEKEAKRLFKIFLKRISSYDRDRDKIFLDNNSRLSPYLRFGCISTREIVRSTSSLKSKGAQIWLSEIVWRDFYQMILEQFPHVEKSSFNPKYKNLIWPGITAHFNKWKKGETGYPIIDAAMRCFNETGEMHNRLRMIVASFLVKDLLIDWKKGEKYFADKLLDFDLASNNGGWQWCASTGCDAQPYFRIFNPITQSEKFDPDGKFISKWIPELSELPRKYIHFPIKTPKDIQQGLNCIIGKNYPSPIVDHSTQRELALKLYKSAK